jgi:hypothetical protein
VPAEDLGYEAAELLRHATAGEARSLNKLAELAVNQVPGCSAANASVWRGGELVYVAATHPDTAELAELQVKSGSGPLITAVRELRMVTCPDLLNETRWPEFADEALRRGMRCSVHLVRDLAPLRMALSLFGVRKGALDTASVPMASMLAYFGHAVLANTLVHDHTQRTASQLQDSVASRAVVDQAKGILMHALGCDADQALAYLRQQSQRRHVKVTEVAAAVISSHGGSGGR